MSVAEIIMLRFLSGNTKKDIIENGKIHLKIGVVQIAIDKKMWKIRLKWFGHVHVIAINVPIIKK